MVPSDGTHLVEPPCRLEVAAGEVDGGSFETDGSGDLQVYQVFEALDHLTKQQAEVSSTSW